MIGTLVTVLVDGYAAIDRATDRRLLLIEAAKRCEAYAKAGQKRQLLIVRHPDQMRPGSLLARMPDASAVVFVDCALELCDTEEDLISCWNEVARVSRGQLRGVNVHTGDLVDNVYVLSLQSWATGRTTLDPRVRWILTDAPPHGPLQYRPYGKRSSILADTRKANLAKIRNDRLRRNGQPEPSTAMIERDVRATQRLSEPQDESRIAPGSLLARLKGT